MIKENRVNKINEIANSHVNGNHSWCKAEAKKLNRIEFDYLVSELATYFEFDSNISRELIIDRLTY